MAEVLACKHITVVYFSVNTRAYKLHSGKCLLSRSEVLFEMHR